MKRFVITNTILSRAEGATPADVTWYRGEDHAQAIAALVQAAAHQGDVEGSALPESMKYDVTAVRMDIFDVPEPGATPSTEARNCRVCGSPVNEAGFCTMPQHPMTDHCPMNTVVQ